jgi:hypothetical protein
MVDPAAPNRPMVILSLMAISWLAKPTEVITNVVAEEGTDNRKEPSGPVEVPTLVPLAVTEAPTTGDPSLLSVTLPETVLSWAKATWNANSIRTGSNIALMKRLGVINSGFKFKVGVNYVQFT